MVARRPSTEWLPDFIIVGAMKSGSTSLGRYLAMHPQIRIPKQELHFFNRPKLAEKGAFAYSEHLRKSLADPDELRSGQLLVGEKTPAYSYFPGIAEQIAAMLPEVKLIWVLRDPVKRSYSNYLHGIWRGADYVSFDQAIERESERIKKNLIYGYVKRSFYHEQIETYLEYFNLDQMHFLRFEDLVGDPAGTLRKLQLFLALEVMDLKGDKAAYNVTTLPWFPWLTFAAGKVVGKRNLLFKAIIQANLLGRKPGYPKMSAAAQEHLARVFVEPNRKLTELTGLDTSDWTKPAANDASEKA